MFEKPLFAVPESEIHVSRSPRKSVAKMVADECAVAFIERLQTEEPGTLALVGTNSTVESVGTVCLDPGIKHFLSDIKADFQTPDRLLIRSLRAHIAFTDINNWNFINNLMTLQQNLEPEEFRAIVGPHLAEKIHIWYQFRVDQTIGFDPETAIMH